MIAPNPEVLVVEHEPEMRNFFRSVLGMDEYRVVEASTASEGLREAAMRGPDVVLADLGLPDFDGIKLTRRIREWSDVPVLVSSRREGKDYLVRALDEGADDYLTIPISGCGAPRPASACAPARSANAAHLCGALRHRGRHLGRRLEAVACSFAASGST